MREPSMKKPEISRNGRKRRFMDIFALHSQLIRLWQTTMRGRY
jgi:hypothetical protein